ncbi:M15 family metallopeptidase [Prochlorococcus marinus]|uniref:D-alanyl-D-alanine dipeptidase n=1 Tax=Prochlorococcus marinus XMU1408 TaxID=2213228 RepID=A0A318RGF5_PROMR|nr:M15 family metallopeptidase [Prochlorococcus marinus]MBW3041758.1 D-alanyl-D-alanine dipeptidase [Prochlorococcus marinus str. XMU1408]PYE02903.1 D-alanyl-D-alanine dipeptidase [Prochlorococcus marinus XMU1408]
MKPRPWNNIKINESNEPLVSIPKSIFRLTPHPYMSLGAPYRDGADPWVLRKSVLNRLLEAQKFLSKSNPHLQLALFDAWRPISVQKFMFDYTIKETCKSRGIDINNDSENANIDRIIQEVGRFWAKPSLNPSTPPPHSTGAAIDLTLADMNGKPLDLGGEIDFIGAKSSPSFYESESLRFPCSKYQVFHNRRFLLFSVMEQAGFVQHPNEWWHFSYGDQLWSWLKKQRNAIYGAAFEVSNDITFSLPSLVT